MIHQRLMHLLIPINVQWLIIKTCTQKTLEDIWDMQIVRNPFFGHIEGPFIYYALHQVKSTYLGETTSQWIEEMPQ